MCSGDRRFKQSPVTVRASCWCGSQIDQVCVAVISRAYGLANAGKTGQERMRSSFVLLSVMQHLGVLTASGVVIARRRGRDRVNYFNPVPLREWYERWVQPLADADSARLLAVKREAEKQEHIMPEAIEPIRTVRLLTSCESPPAPSGPSR